MASPLLFTGFAWKNLWRRRLRTLLTLVGITKGIGAFAALVGFLRSFEQDWLRIHTSSYKLDSLTILSGPLAGAYPAWRDARLSAVEAVRYE